MTGDLLPTQGFWWDEDADERYWIEQLKTDRYGYRLISPRSRTYATTAAVRPGDIVFHWYSERHPSAGPRRSGIFAVSGAVSRPRRTTDTWDDAPCVEVRLTRRVLLRRPVLLSELRAHAREFRVNQEALQDAIGDRASHSPWQFPATGMKPVLRYLTKFTQADVEELVRARPDIALALGSLASL